MADWTPEPWRVTEYPSAPPDRGRIVIETVNEHVTNGVVVAYIRETMHMRPGEVMPNATRIVAAINSCAGLSTSALERGVVADLRAACGSVVKLWIPGDDGQVVILRAAFDEAQAALSKAKGEG